MENISKFQFYVNIFIPEDIVMFFVNYVYLFLLFLLQFQAKTDLIDSTLSMVNMVEFTKVVQTSSDDYMLDIN